MFMDATELKARVEAALESCEVLEGGSQGGHTLEFHCHPNCKEAKVIIAVWNGRRVALREIDRWVSLVPGYGFFEEGQGEETIFHFAKLH
jgi:hypothetical protein